MDLEDIREWWMVHYDADPDDAAWAFSEFLKGQCPHLYLDDDGHCDLCGHPYLIPEHTP